MGALERYILRSTFTAFATSLFAITGVVWVSQALRDFDVITAKGQTFWTFFAITLLAIPSFALIVAPFALFGAVVFVLNRLNTDSELAAISAAGVKPWRLLRPFLTLTLLVSLAAGALSLSAIPASLRALRDILTEIRADIVINILREGEFTQIDKALTVHVRRREEGAVLAGILIDDNREASENVVYTAERGQVVKNDNGTFLLLRNGAMQRKKGSEDAAVVVFDSYAFDLSPFAERDIVVSYRPRELYLSEIFERKTTREPAERTRLLAEINERLVNAIYPFAFMCIAFAALGRPYTTRQGRFKSIIAACLVIFLLRIASLGLVNMSKSNEWVGPVLYLLLFGSSAIALAYALEAPQTFRRLIAGRRAPATA